MVLSPKGVFLNHMWLKPVFFFPTWQFTVCPWHFLKKCPWFWKSARDKKPQILAVKIDELPLTRLHKNSPWKMKSARENFWNFARDITKSARDKPVVFYPIFSLSPGKSYRFLLPGKSSSVIHSFIQKPIFFCTKKRAGKTASLLLTRKSPHAIHSKSDGVSIIV